MNNNLIDPSASLYIWQLAILICIVLWMYCLIDILKNKFEGNDKIIWTLVVILIPALGSILYLFIGKTKKNKNLEAKS